MAEEGEESEASEGEHGSARGVRKNGGCRLSSWVPGRSCYSYPRPPSWHPQTKSGGRAAISFGSLLCNSLGTYLISRGRPRRRADWSLQRGVTAPMVAGGRETDDVHALMVWMGCVRV